MAVPGRDVPQNVTVENLRFRVSAKTDTGIQLMFRARNTDTIIQALFLGVLRKLKVEPKKLKPNLGQITQSIGVNLKFCLKQVKKVYNYQPLGMTA